MQSIFSSFLNMPCDAIAHLDGCSDDAVKVFAASYKLERDDSDATARRIGGLYSFDCVGLSTLEASDSTSPLIV